ncbi:hypothetical protein [Methylocapsa palsarum]|uniref:Uncharacterized protein n=1 Tax=Methylocapsa palsarum TaxID=1612308 RepID=A0A1I4AE87_9HYPH|nr:hypothetical protein [Methylocapsa palsarum]SFK54745.1 hypothetical protein SAMN05444581_11046 [Methylocapsa palsarum]
MLDQPLAAFQKQAKAGNFIPARLYNRSLKMGSAKRKRIVKGALTGWRGFGITIFPWSLKDV